MGRKEEEKKLCVKKKMKMFSVYDEWKSHPVDCALTAEVISLRLISPQ